GARVRGAGARRAAERAARVRAAGVREGEDRAAQVSSPRGLRRRAAQDRDRQDPPPPAAGEGAVSASPEGTPRDFETPPARYRHWRLALDGRVARLALAVDENGALFDGVVLKRNSYDLGVDLELRDAVQRLRFEHPQVACVVVESALPDVFCAGA